MYGYVWICMDMCGYVWICVHMYGNVWTCLGGWAVSLSGQRNRPNGYRLGIVLGIVLGVVDFLFPVPSDVDMCGYV